MSSDESMKLTYLEIDEDGEPIAPRGRPGWQLTDTVPMAELCQRAMTICGGRRFFKNKSERFRWKLIARSILHSRMPMEWFEAKLAWAKEMNKEQTKIVFSDLLTALGNVEAMKDWKAKHMQLKDVEFVNIKEAGDERPSEAEQG